VSPAAVVCACSPRKKVNGCPAVRSSPTDVHLNHQRRAHSSVRTPLARLSRNLSLCPSSLSGPSSPEGVAAPTHHRNLSISSSCVSPRLLPPPGQTKLSYFLPPSRAATLPSLSHGQLSPGPDHKSRLEVAGADCCFTTATRYGPPLAP
jgi:hypothetical protein